MNEEQRLNIIKLNNEDRLAGKLVGSRAPSDEDVKFLLDRINHLTTPLEYAAIRKDAWDDAGLDEWVHPVEYTLWTRNLYKVQDELKKMGPEVSGAFAIYSRPTNNKWTPVIK